MAEQKRKLVMDIVASPTTHDETASSKKSKLGKLLEHIRPKSPSHRQLSTRVYQLLIKRWYLVVICLALIPAGILLAHSLIRPNPTAAALDRFTKDSSFKLYYPSSMPNYYFVITGQITSSDNVVEFPIRRDDGQTIQVAKKQIRLISAFPRLTEPGTHFLASGI